MKPGPRTVLLIEDNPGDARLIREMLAEARGTTFRLEWAHCLSEGLGRLAAAEFDALLLDLSLPDCQGLETFQRAQAQAPGVPIVVLTGLDDDAVSNLALHDGAQDYLVKGRVDSDLLVRSLRYAIERKQSEAALRESERRYRTLVETMTECLVQVDNDDVIQFVNERTCQLSGYSREELLYQKAADLLIVEEDREIIAEKNRLRRRQVADRYEIRMKKKTGEVIWAQVGGAPVVDAGGVVIGSIGVHTDITERKQAEAEREHLLNRLESERNWLRAVIEHSPVGIILIEDASGARVLANRRAEQLFGFPFSPQRGIGQYVELICHPDGRPCAYHETVSVRALQGEVVVAEERQLCRLDHKEVPLVVSGGPIRDGAGNVVGAVVMFEDITTLKELERLREEWNSVIAHDLRQPIAVITGYAGLLARHAEEYGAPLKNGAEHILASARQLNRMVSDLLDVSRIEARRLALDRQTVQVPPLVAAVVERSTEVTQGRPVRVEIKGEVPCLVADPGRLEQILGNLLSNATKYGYPDSEIRVEVEPRGTEIQVSVTNQGDGIDPEDLSRLFTRFQRTQQAQQSGTGGIGLGLYITRGLVEAHGGQVWAESVPGETTTFRFTLPVAGPSSAGPE